MQQFGNLPVAELQMKVGAIFHIECGKGAEVVAHNPVRDLQDGSISYESVMQYNAHGQTQTMIGKIRTNPPAYKIGEKVNIVYDGTGRGEPKIVSYWGLYLGAIIMMVLAVNLIVICGGFFLFKAGFL